MIKEMCNVYACVYCSVCDSRASMVGITTLMAVLAV